MDQQVCKILIAVALLFSVKVSAIEIIAQAPQKSTPEAPSPISEAKIPKEKEEQLSKKLKQLELFNTVLHQIETQYYREIDSEKLIEGAVKGMLETLDPHSGFLNKEIYSRMQTETNGEFGGLGIEVTQKDGVMIVITPIEDTPAHKAGIRPGDRIVELENESAVGITLDEAVEKMRGKPGTKAKIGITRPDMEGIKYYYLEREIIRPGPVKYELVEDQYAYIHLTQFQKNSASSITKAINTLKEKVGPKGIQGMILDLRSNPGGLLDEAVAVSSLFLREGIVVKTEARDPTQIEIRYVDKSTPKELDVPLAVLINGSSASASEIVAGALQDHGRAIIMGTRSFGKGSVQAVSKIDSDKGIKLTIAQYMTPNNRKIQALGIKPNIEIEEFDGKWPGKGKRKNYAIREVDLRNHLTATIESKEEKEVRLEKEKSDRMRRIAEYEEAKKKKISKTSSDDDDDDIIRLGPVKEDYQVVQAINYLRGLKFLKKTILAKETLGVPASMPEVMESAKTSGESVSPDHHKNP